MIKQNPAAAREDVTAISGSDESHSECGSCTCSQTSTDLYDHEPFETFVQKVHTLLVTLFPDNLPIEMERLRGGSYNRVVCGALNCNAPNRQCRVIVRMSRFGYHSHVNEVAILRFLKESTGIRVPRVLHYDGSGNNILSDRFMILERLPGICLEDTYKAMTVEMKKLVVLSVVRLLKQLSEITFDAIGTLISSSPDGIGLTIGHEVDIFDETQCRPPPLSAHACSVHGYLEERWSFFVAEEQRQNPGDTFDLRFTSSFRAAMVKLDISDTEKPARIVLHHTDLAPRNIFVDPTSGVITGVLDWDKAESAPVEAAWQMPIWLWDTDANGSNQLRWKSPDDIPLDPRAAEIQQFFLDEIEKVLPDFVETIRGSKHVFDLLRFARVGLHSEEIIYQARNFLGELNVEIPPA